MYCPECGHDAGDAKFCPECGADLESLRNALKGKTTGQAAGGRGRQGGGQGRPGERGGGSRQATAAEPAQPARGFSPAVIWGIFGAVAVVVIVVVVMLPGGFGGKAGNAATAGSASATPVMGVTAGSYGELVQKANDFYNQGDSQFKDQNVDQGVAYFQAAAMTYAAAWSKQSTDPNVGTDFATSLFYAGNIDAAIKQVATVIKMAPDFQPAYFNLGNYYSHKALIAKQSGGSDASVQKIYDQAKQAYTKAVSIDPTSTVGKQADVYLRALPK